MTDTNPEEAEVLIAGASSAKTFRVADVGNHDRFLDALWNRSGQTCRTVYKVATEKASRTRPNLDRLSAMLAAHGLTSLQTNVACASAPFDADVSDKDRTHGTELFKAVVAHVPWKAMILYGVSASERFGQAFGVAVPPVPAPDSTPIHLTVHGRPVFISPTLATPSYRTSVWPYLERVVAQIAGRPSEAAPSARPLRLEAASLASPKRVPREPPARFAVSDVPPSFNSSAANELVWRRMHAIAAASNLTFDPSDYQAALTGGPELSTTTRVFRHKFNAAKADLLVRDDVFLVDVGLQQAGAWTTHKTPIFQTIRTGDLQLLGRIMDAVEASAAAKARRRDRA